jgi:IS5 family transposase
MAMRQLTLASQSSFEKHGRKSKRELFLDQMEQVVPWCELLALVEPHYPKAGNGWQPVGLAIMPRTYFLQQWFNLSDPGMEEAFYESPVRRRFAGVDLPPHGRRPVRGDPGWAQLRRMEGLPLPAG